MYPIFGLDVIYHIQIMARRANGSKTANKSRTNSNLSIAMANNTISSKGIKPRYYKGQRMKGIENASLNQT